MQQNNLDLMALFTTLPGSNVLLLPDAPLFTIVAVSEDYLQITGRHKEELIDKGLFDVFPNNPADPNLTSEKTVRASLEYALAHKEPHYLPIQQYDVIKEDGTFAERYWLAHNKPILNKDGEVVYLIHHVEEVTEKIKAKQRNAQLKNMEKTFGLFMHAPMVVALVNGDDYILEMANEAAFKLWGKGAAMIGKPILQELPQLEAQGIIALFDQVRASSEPYFANEVPVTSAAMGQKELHYFNLVYQPYYTEGNPKPTGVFTISHDVTEQVKARQAVLESETKYRTLFESMDQGFCIIEILFDAKDQPNDYRFLEVNPVFVKQTGLIEAAGKTARELVPGIEKHWIDLYAKVALTGEPISFIEESKALNRWFEANAFKIGGTDSRKVALLFTDISERKKAEKAIIQSEGNLRNTILQAPVAMAILRGPSFIVEIANKRMYELWGRSQEELVEKSIFEGLPEVKDQGYEELLTSVFATGKTFTASGTPVTVPREENVETVYINFTYEAFREADGTISGVIVVASDVTDQVIARKRVEAINQELQFVTDTMPQLAWATESNGYSYFFNRGWLEYTGLALEEVKGDGWMQSLHPDDLERTQDAWTHAFKDGAAYDIEYRLRRYDGTYRWFLTRGTPMKDEQGHILKWYGTTTDVHEQKRSAEALIESNERFDLVAKATQDAIWDWNLVTNQLWWNEGYKELFGYKDSEIESTADSWYNHIHPDDKEHITRTIHQVIDNGGKNWSAEYRFRRRDGRYAVVFDRGYALHDKDGKAYRMLGSMQDITERKRTEEALRRSEERLQRALSIETVGVIYFDLEGVIHDANTAFERMSGYSREAFANGTIRWNEVTPAAFMEATLKSREELLTKGQSTPYEKQYIRPDGSRWWGLFAGKRLSENECVEFILDITANKQFEEELEHKVKERTSELEKANQELKRSNKNLEEFAYAASHDLKEPTRKIHIFSERLKESLGERMSASEKKYFERMELASRRMTTLIDDLLMYSEVSQRAILEQEVDINYIIDCVLSDLDLEIEQKNATIHVDKLFTITGHRRQLQQAFQNLISNALKYSKPDTPPAISIRCDTVKGADTTGSLSADEQTKDYYLVTVSDNGIGFDQADAERIFNVFTRLHGMAEYKGTGVGLSIVRKVVENHHGHIWAESQPDIGTTFQILLPVV